MLGRILKRGRGRKNKISGRIFRFRRLNSVQIRFDIWPHWYNIIRRSLASALIYLNSGEGTTKTILVTLCGVGLRHRFAAIYKLPAKQQPTPNLKEFANNRPQNPDIRMNILKTAHCPNTQNKWNLMKCIGAPGTPHTHNDVIELTDLPGVFTLISLFSLLNLGWSTADKCKPELHTLSKPIV